MAYKNAMFWLGKEGDVMRKGFRDDWTYNPKDGIRQHRNSVLEEVQNEVNKVHYNRSPTTFTYPEICQIIQRLRV